MLGPLNEHEDVSVAGGDWEDPNDFNPRVITVNQTGDVKLELADDTSATTVALQAGVFYAMRVTKIYQTGTTATGIVVWK